jgi:NADH dehydrogenase [ubiquinone] 1 alpha subcomplex assembly factor 7
MLTRTSSRRRRCTRSLRSPSRRRCYGRGIAWLDRNEPGFAAGVRWIHLDPSPLHRRAQGRSGDDRIGWLQDRDVDTGWGRHSKPDNVPEDPARFALLCEVLDACPFDLYERTATGWAELLVASDGVRFCETRRPLHSRSGGTADPTDLDDYLLFRSARAAAGLQPVPAFVGQRVADFHPAMDLLERAWDATRGTVLAVDYMEHPERLWVPERADFVRAYRGHALCSPLDDPGDADITATLDLAQVSFHVRGSILPDENEQLESLESFLLRHGILDELNRIDRSTVEGASSYLRLRQLLLPTGMGTAFKVQRFDRAA